MMWALGGEPAGDAARIIGQRMPMRATKRGAERTRLEGRFDAIVCGASFAGLAVARELAGARARVLVLDRYEIGERQTSACAAPTEWLTGLGLEGSIRQTFDRLVVHTPFGSTAWSLPWTFSTFDYRTLCQLLWDQASAAEFETAKVEGARGEGGAIAPRSWSPETARGGGAVTVRTDRGDVSAPLVVDALGWRRVLGAGEAIQPPEAYLSRGLEVHPHSAGPDLELWLDRRYVPAGYGWSFPAAEELRVGVGSFDPRFHVKEPTVRLADDVGVEAVRYQGNWIPHRLRPAAEDGVFFVGDSAGHCLPTTAEGIRTAFYFAIACGRELRAVLEGRRGREEALARYAAFSARHRWKFEALLGVQWLVPRVPPRALHGVVRAFGRRPVAHWSFRRYLDIAPPAFAQPAPPVPAKPAAVAA